jgi:hypothetical protein
MNLYVIHSVDVDVDIRKERSVYAPRQTVYLVPDHHTFTAHLSTIYEIEKDRNNWIRSYQNILNGLNYWRSRALSK